MMVLAIILMALFILDAVRLRVRLQYLVRLPRSNELPSADYVVVLSEGVVLRETMLRSACEYARAQQLEVLDLVPGNWDAYRYLGLAQLVDPRTYRKDRLATGRTAAHAVLVHREVVKRLPEAAEWDLDADRVVLSRFELIQLAPVLKRYAAVTTDLAIAPYLEAVADAPDRSRAYLKEILGGMAWAATLGTPVVLALLILCMGADLLVGAIALVAFHVQPALALAGTPMARWELAVLVALRSPIELWRWLILVTGSWKPPEEPDPVAALRPVYNELLGSGTRPFFEDRRDSCPLCDARELRHILSTTDLIQHKPGRFTLHQCITCDHIFQNPRLSLEGLDYYYRDFYDGLGEAALENVFGHAPDPYIARAEMVKGAATPKRWLDVGGGHGHFCCVARDVWPDTAFDALDLSESVEEAKRRRWVDNAHRGLFPELASNIAGTYDVVSMSHYLEQTREPREELAAAHTALTPGGHLMIEVPDPDYRLGRKLGRWWVPWFQPQHQHLINTANMDKLLEEAGFEALLWHTGVAHQAVDFLFVAYLMLNKLACPMNAPWLPPMTTVGKVRHRAVWILGIPFLGLAWCADRITALFMKTARHSNTYRVLAQKVSTSGSPPLNPLE